jgi:hypothetical protein
MHHLRRLKDLKKIKKIKKIKIKNKYAGVCCNILVYKLSED